jgi:O-antigen ligase
MMPGYAALLAVVGTAILFSNVSLYLFESKLTEAPPLWWIGALAALALPLTFQYARTLVVPVTGVLWWAAGYLLVSLCWFVAFPTTESGVQELRERTLAVGLIALVWLIVRQPGALTAARWTVLVATLFAAGMNFYDFFVPGTFSTTIGRAAGLYMNPNISGAALVLGMLVAAPLLPARWLFPFIITVGLAVLATFSRAAILGWLLTVLVIAPTALRAMGVSRLLLTLSAIAAISVALGEALSEEDATRASLRGQVVLDRLGVFAGEEGPDFSTAERRDLVDAALESVARHPWTGAGLGTNRFLAHETGSHNIFLDLAVQHGLVGLLILPMLALALIARSRGPARRSAVMAGGFLLFWGLFSHNVLEEFYILTAVVILAAVAHESFAGDPAEVSA